MWFDAALRALPASLLLYLSVLPTFTTASPSIDVGLHASFPAPPFLLELLETAAEENATAYFPLLATVATGRFQDAVTDSQLYHRFLSVLKEDGHLANEVALSSFKFAMSVHSAAPRIEAQYQFYRSSVAHLDEGEHNVVSMWKPTGLKCLDYDCDKTRDTEGVQDIDHTTRNLPFDRVSGNPAALDAWTAYMDISSPSFPQEYQQWQKRYTETPIPLRIRYKAPLSGQSRPLVVSGYGVELALKRTDYIVIDDRDANEKPDDGSDKPTAEVVLETGENIRDLKPLSSSELSTLGIKAASYIMTNEDPFETFVKVSQDFPKYAAALASSNLSTSFVMEHKGNRDIFLPPGYNALWLNGMQLDAREVDAFSFLERMRRERRLIGDIQGLGFSALEAVSILSHPEIAEAQSSADAQRYDYRDELEGGKVIIWLNDIEKDRRYSEWPIDVKAFLQRVFPGQLPSVRKEAFVVVVPVDFSDRKQIVTVIDTLQSLVTRQVPSRFGMVPTMGNAAASEQARIIYHLHETYGLSTVMQYLRKSAEHARHSRPNAAAFESAIEDRKARRDQTVLSMENALTSERLSTAVTNAEQYLVRLGADGTKPPILANGAVIPNSDSWLQAISERFSVDLRTIQLGVYEGRITQSAWLPSLWLAKASSRRNSLIVPENEKNIKLVDVPKLYKDAKEILKLQPMETQDAETQDNVGLLIVADLNADSSRSFVVGALSFAIRRSDVVITLAHQSNRTFSLTQESRTSILTGLAQSLSPDNRRIVEQYLHALTQETERSAKRTIVDALGLTPGDQAVLIGGRLLGPLQHERPLSVEDFETLLIYERAKRIDPTVLALDSLGLTSKAETQETVGMLSSLIALSSVCDVAEGMMEGGQSARSNMFNQWEFEHTSFTSGDADSPLQLVVALDPASEVAQRWVPIIHALSKLSGVHTRMFLNPQNKLDELPVKRFYRHVLGSEPEFLANGSVVDIEAHFASIPQDTLLTMNMDLPASWLVAPRDSVHDLDNIKLSSLKGYSKIEATYELEHILIEGHSRDVTLGTQPRGAQLVLSTEDDPNFAGTIIMANLGYFQFKANPGVFDLALQKGRSSQIYKIDSAGTMGHGAKDGDETTEILLTSFQGATLFPRLSRKAGQETEDVLEPPSNTANHLVHKGVEMADGLSGGRASKYWSKGLEFGQKILGKTGLISAVARRKHADINIFSVASGHLYERMLNIMMVSVMRHTKHTVKFWFIEQFLSPSFKSFLPTMAAEYGFEYEMVTYKWPHWLRAQKEKQRIIWGYKILFLDVLFPLDLDKVIFVDADQIVRTDMYELVTHDLEGAPYGFTPMCDSRTEMEGFRFWKQGYWKNFLRGLPYHISALYVVDLQRFRQIAAGDRLRGQYHQLSADPNSLSNLDQDLPNHMQAQLPIHSLPQEWLWCETWCSDEALKEARTIDLCNNPQTKEPKLDRARRQVPEWTVYDEEIAALARRSRDVSGQQEEEVTAKGKSEAEKQAAKEHVIHREL